VYRRENPAKGPTDAIANLLGEDLFDLISALPEKLRESVVKLLRDGQSERNTDLPGETPPLALK
jgi:hypothetical protein